MKIHKREYIVEKEGLKIRKAFIDSELTYGEAIKVISDILANWAKYIIRAERHPDDPDKPGGLE